MPSDSTAGGTSNESAASFNDFASLATAKVEEIVSIVRDRTVAPVLRAVRFAIFGLLAVSVGVLLAILLAVGAVRLLDDYLFHWRVWASYLIVGGIFSGLGLFLSRMRHPRS
ncbi:MAG: hypothetical protein ACYCST_11055 [Acidimicrobiales bacterium]